MVRRPPSLFGVPPRYEVFDRRLSPPMAAGRLYRREPGGPVVVEVYDDLLREYLKREPPFDGARFEWVLDVAFFVTGQELTRSRFTAYVGWLTLIVVFVLLANLSAGRTGRRWRAVRDDEVSAELAGIDLGRSRVSAFMVSAAAAGAAGPPRHPAR